MTINLSDINPGIIALISVALTSPIVMTVVNFYLFRRKNQAETESAVLKNMQMLINAYKDNKELDDQRKQELYDELKATKLEFRQIHERQADYIRNSTELLQQWTDTNKRLDEMKIKNEECVQKHEDCTRDHTNALAEIDKLKKLLNVE